VAEKLTVVRRRGGGKSASVSLTVDV